MSKNNAIIASEAPPAATAPETSGVDAVTLREQRAQAVMRTMFETPLTEKEDAFAREYVVTCNASEAYRRTHETYSSTNRQMVWTHSHFLMKKPHIAARIREYKKAVAMAHIIDVDAIIAQDMAIIEAADYCNEISQLVIDSCRYCHGINHRYQWKTAGEYLNELSRVMDENEKRAARRQRQSTLPSDEGGYGFSREASPAIDCPQCEGSGVPRVVFADTRTLSGPAARLYRGIKQTANGIEIQLADIDKAKERVMRRTGTYGDDPAAVARGAAVGAALGARVAEAAAARVESMDEEQARRLYLQLANA